MNWSRHLANVAGAIALLTAVAVVGDAWWQFRKAAIAALEYQPASVECRPCPVVPPAPPAGRKR